MKHGWSRGSRVLRILAIAVVVLILGLYLVLPFAMAVFAVFPYKDAVGAPPAGFKAITLQTEDGVTLAGWHLPPANGAAILLIAGAGDAREAVRSHAEMLARHGYGVLALDLRGHGQSGGETNRFGWQSTQDVGAAVAYLDSRDDVQAIGGLGLSLGGEALLGAASAYPALQAIVADGATRRSIPELIALPSERSLVRNFTARVMFAGVALLSGDKAPKPLLDSMVEAGSTQYLLIAAGGEEMEGAFNQRFVEAVGPRAALWVAPEVSHIGAFARYPDEYEQRVIAFFDAALLDH